MDMEPTLFFIFLIVITNLSCSLQEGNDTAVSNYSLENFNDMIDKLIADTERKVTTTPETDTTITQTTEKGMVPIMSIAKKDNFKSNPEKTNDLKSSTEKETPDTINLNATQPGNNPNNSRIIYINNLFPYDKTIQPVDEDNMLLRQGNLDDNKELDSDTTLNLGANTAEPEYLNLSPLDDRKKPSWLNSEEGVVDDREDLSFFLNTRRNFDGNNPFSSMTENHKDHGAGVILKEEIVFEIEDDKPAIPPNPPIKIRMHTTTPKPVASHPKEEIIVEIDDDNPTIPSNSPIKVRFHTTTPKPVLFLLKPVKDNNINTTYFPFRSSMLRTRNVFGSKTNKSMYSGKVLRAHNNYFYNVTKYHNVSSLLRAPQITMEAEFNKLHEKINTLQEFLNRTLDKENVTDNISKVHSDKSDMRTGYPSYHMIEKGRSRNRMRYDTTPDIFYSKQQPFMEHPLPLLLQDIHFINRLRTRSKYIVPIPVYRRRVVFKPLAGVL